MTTPHHEPDPTAATTRAIGVATAPGQPDPSAATTRAIETAAQGHSALVDVQLRAVVCQIEAVEATSRAERAGLRETITQRLDDMDRANVIRAADSHRVPTELQGAIAALKELANVKFDSVAAAAAATTAAITDRFELNDRQTVREKAAADLALAAAFDAQKEAAAAQNNANAQAIQKSEAATAEKIQKNDEAMRTGQAATNDKIEDLKDRLVRAEALIIALQTQRTSNQESHADTRGSANIALVALGLVVAIIVAAVSIYAAMKP